MSQNEAITDEQLASFEAATRRELDTDRFLDLLPPEFKEAEFERIVKSFIKDSWTTSNLEETKRITDTNAVTSWLREGGVLEATNGILITPPGTLSGEFNRFVTSSRIPNGALANELGRATDDPTKPIIYTQIEARGEVGFLPPPVDLLAPVLNLLSSYIDEPDSTKFISFLGEDTISSRRGLGARVSSAASITNLSGEPIYWGIWNNATGFVPTPLQRQGGPDAPVTSFVYLDSLNWITFVPSSLSSLRAIRGRRDYSQVAFMRGLAYYQGFPLRTADGRRLIEGAPSSPLTEIKSTFSLDFGADGLARGVPSGILEFTTADGSTWRFDFEKNAGGSQNGNESFRGFGLGTVSIRPGRNVINSGNDLLTKFSVLANVFNAHSRIYGPHAPGAGFAGTIDALRTEIIEVPDLGAFALSRPQLGTLSGATVILTTE